MAITCPLLTRELKSTKICWSVRRPGFHGNGSHGVDGSRGGDGVDDLSLFPFAVRYWETPFSFLKYMYPAKARRPPVRSRSRFFSWVPSALSMRWRLPPGGSPPVEQLPGRLPQVRQRGLITRACHGAALPRLRQGGDNVKDVLGGGQPQLLPFPVRSHTTSRPSPPARSPDLLVGGIQGTQGGSDLEGADSSMAASWVRAWLAIRRFAATSARAELFPIGTEKLNPTDHIGYRVLPRSPIASRSPSRAP